MTTTASREWVSIAEAATELGVHARTLRRYIRDGKLAVQRLSPQVVRIERDDIEKFLEANIKVPTGTGTCYVPRPPEPVAASTGDMRRPSGLARFSG